MSIYCVNQIWNVLDFVLVKAFLKFVNKNFTVIDFLEFFTAIRSESVKYLPSKIVWSLLPTSDSFHQECFMARKDPHIERLGEVLDKSLKRLELSPRIDEYGVWPVWNEVVGKTIACNAQPEKIRNGTLFVKVTSPVWMQQLQFMKEMIAEKLNQRLKGEIVKNIFFVVGRIDADMGEDNPTGPAPEEPQLERIEPDAAFLESLTDPEIRQAFKRLLKGYTRRQRKD